MTHNELLDKIYWHWRKDNRGDGLKPMIDYRSVILAVVELHKPDMRGNCDICSWIIGKPGFVHYSACPTIQAIEKELG